MGAPSYSAFSSLWRFSPLLKTVRRTLSQRRSPPRGSPGRRKRERRKAGRTSQRNQEKEGKERRKAGRTRRTSQQRNRKQEGKEGRGPTRTDLAELLLEPVWKTLSLP